MPRSSCAGTATRRSWRFSGQHLVPVLRDGERIVSDSWAIACYLDEAYPDRPMLMDGAQGRSFAGSSTPGRTRLSDGRWYARSTSISSNRCIRTPTPANSAGGGRSAMARPSKPCTPTAPRISRSSIGRCCRLTSYFAISRSSLERRQLIRLHRVRHVADAAPPERRAAVAAAGCCSAMARCDAALFNGLGGQRRDAEGREHRGPLIEARSISKEFQAGDETVHALRDISFDIARASSSPSSGRADAARPR